jgi:vancomycin resistance protein YoaR
MKSDQLEPLGLKEQSKSAASSPAQPAVRTSARTSKGGDGGARPAPATAARAREIDKGLPRFVALRHVDMRLVGFGAAFVGAAVATLFLLSAAAFGLKGSYDSRVLPGVHVGSVDLSGLTRNEAMAKLKSDYAYLSSGEVTVTTPVGVTTITYQQIDRGPDIEAMADAAMSVGHSGNPIADASSAVHSTVFGQDVPVVIRIDPTALAERIHDLVTSTSVPAQNAQATSKGGSFSITPAATGTGVDELPLGSWILDKLTQASAPVDLQAGGSYVTLKPQVGDTDAQKAIDGAGKMAVDLKLTWQTAPDPLPAGWKAKTWTLSADEIRSWIVFGVRQDGTYGPAVDPAQVEAYLAGISGTANIPATKPSALFDASGKPKTLKTGTNGVGIDLTATTDDVASYLDSLAEDGSFRDSMEVTAATIAPQIKANDVSKYQIIGQETIYFFPGPANGNGANIRVPARDLNGEVVAPGQQFSFLAGVGPIDAAHGFAMGGVILNGQSNHTGAMGGGICSASTTMFNAAAKAGLQIDERHAHFYYISRYPIGRDATVYSNGSTTWDLRWTNDTNNPIIIRAWATKKSKSSITIQLWSLPTGRTVSWTGDNKAGETRIISAVNNPPEYVTTLKPGKTYAAEVATNGFNTSVTRTVKDATGKIIHQDNWKSQYTAVNGQLQIGATPIPTPTPKPTPKPTLTAIYVPLVAPLLLAWKRRRSRRRAE